MIVSEEGVRKNPFEGGVNERGEEVAPGRGIDHGGEVKQTGDIWPLHDLDKWIS